MSIGSMLKEGRKKAGLGREEMACAIRITPDCVRALEEEDWESLPDMVFVRGFVVSWCRATGMDELQATDLLSRENPVNFAAPVLPRLHEPTGIVIGSRSARKRKTARLMLVGLLILAALAAAWFSYRT